MKELPKICNRLKQDLYNLYKFTQDTLSKNVDTVNQSLGDYDLDSKFDGSLSNGFWSNSFILTPYNDNVCNTNPISCKEGDVIRVKLSKSATDGRVRYFNASNTLIGNAVVFSGTEYKGTAPSGATKMCFTVVGSGFTKDNIGHIRVYINNEIDTIKESLQGLKVKVFTGTTPNYNSFVRLADSEINGDNIVSYMLFVDIDGIMYSADYSDNWVKFNSADKIGYLYGRQEEMSMRPYKLIITYLS